MRAPQSRLRAALVLTTLLGAGCSPVDERAVGRQQDNAVELASPRPMPPPPPPPPPTNGQDKAGSGKTPNTPEQRVELPPSESASPVSGRGDDRAKKAPGNPRGGPQPPGRGNNTSTSSQVAPPTPGPATKTRPMPVRLSMGVALPQTTVWGTVMGFSVEYQFTDRPDASARYVWVIERAEGQPARLTGPLKSQGTLQTLVRKWRPEEGPFRTHLEDYRGNRLSASIPLQ